MIHYLEEGMLEKFESEMKAEEKSINTIRKYMHDIRTFFSVVGENCAIQKESTIWYKEYLTQKHQLTSANSMLAAINHFFRFCGWEDCIVKSFKIQRQMCRSTEQDLSRDEYARLLEQAKEEGKNWLYSIMLTICSTGIRISELPFITVESLRTRRAYVRLKGKCRVVILSNELCKELKNYVKEKEIKSGSIFVTKNGTPIDRSNIYHAMKKLCEKAGIEKSKVYPHNLRHLFAVTFYKKERDIVHLADILGHSNINTTRIYTLVSIEEHEKKINDLGLVI